MESALVFVGSLGSRVAVLAAVVGSIGLYSASASAQTFSDRFEEIKREASRDQLYAFLWDLPKGGDLHNHLGGAGFPSSWFEIAVDPRRNGSQSFYTRTRVENCGSCPANLTMFHILRDEELVELSACCRREYKRLSELNESEQASWLSSLKIDRPGEGRNEFFEKMWLRIDSMSSEIDVTGEIMVDNMKRFAAEKVRYVEWQLGAFGRTDRGRALPADELAARLEAFLARPDAVDTGVEVVFQANVLRFAPNAEELVEKSYEFVSKHRDRWVGVNLVGREDNDKGYPLRFLETFRKLRRRFHGIELAIHGGEVDEPNRHVRDTLLLGATRIGHGVNLITDPDTLLLMRGDKFLVESSLVSNHLLEYSSEPGVHPFVEYLRVGVPVALATDDRGMWDSNMTDEYMRAVIDFNLSWHELKAITRDSLSYSFANERVKRRLLERLNRELAAFALAYSGDDWRESLRSVRPQISGYARRHLVADEP